MENLEVQRAEEPMTDLMKKHVPVLTIIKQDPLTVEVHVGKLLKHPNEAEHYIGWIELYSEDKLLAKAELTPIATEPIVTFVLNEKVQKLRALEWCNVHGVWEAEIEIKEKN